MRHIAVSLLFVLGVFPVIADSENPPRLINVSGHGEVRYVPDRASLSIAVEAVEEDLADARNEVGTVAARVLAIAKKHGLKDEHISTGELQLAPEYDSKIFSSGRERSGFLARRNIRLELMDLDKLGPVLEDLLAAKITNIVPPTFYSSREDELYREALKLAGTEAAASARVLAVALGAKLGSARSADAHRPVMPARGGEMYMRMREPSQGYAETYKVGEMSISADVNVSFDLVTD